MILSYFHTLIPFYFHKQMVNQTPITFRVGQIGISTRGIAGD